MKPLKQSTAATIVIGPFLDSTDGVTPETGLTLTSADIRLSKAGGAFAAKNDSTAPVHLENGYYSCVLNATDTNTLRDLTLAVFATGSVPVFHEIEILSASGFGLMYGTDGDAILNLKKINIDSDAGPAISAVSSNAPGVDIQGGSSAAALNITTTSSAPAVNISNGGTGLGFSVAASSNNAVFIDANGGIGLKIDGSTKGVQITGETEEGINIIASGSCIKASTNTSANTIDIVNTSSGSALSIGSNTGVAVTIAATAEDAVNITANGGRGIFISAGTAGMRILGNTDGVLIEGGAVDAYGVRVINQSATNATFDISNVDAGGPELSAKEIDTIDTNVDTLITDLGVVDTNVDAIVAKLPAGTISDLALTDQVDGVTLFNIYELVMAMVNGRYEIDNPSAGKITFFKRDNTSILTTVTVSDVNRTRDV